MTHKRNTTGLASSAASKKESTLKKTQTAISELLKANDMINFNTVAEKAGVSKAWLYRETDIADRIKRLRDQQANKEPKVYKETQRASDASKSALVTTLKARVKELEVENRELKKQLEVVYGKLHDASM
ncbi:MAG: transposase [Proteobacteria bacterium]|nr:MAG: transposase [Pseudomonadota bacterium]